MNNRGEFSGIQQKENSKGLRIEPCGTPAMTGRGSDRTVDTYTTRSCEDN